MKDLIAIKNGKQTINEVAEKYNTTPTAIKLAMYRRQIWRRKKRVLLVTPYKTTECCSVEDCARKTNITPTTLLKALRGERVPLLEELNIKVKYIKEVYYDKQTEEEYTDDE